jgi:hypothetical protein
MFEGKWEKNPHINDIRDLIIEFVDLGKEKELNYILIQEVARDLVFGGNNRALFIAAREGKTDFFDKLLDYPNVADNLTIENNSIVKIAYDKNRKNVVDLLLTFPQVREELIKDNDKKYSNLREQAEKLSEKVDYTPTKKKF